jgi:L-ornithine N5-monooxygenase
MTNNKTIYDVLGIGFGPANIAVAIAMESDEVGFKGTRLFLEAKAGSVWQEHMLFEGSDIQNNPLRDLVTPRNPRSRFGFISFLHAKNRFMKFLNTGLHHPYRIEYAQYVDWVARHFEADVRYNTHIREIQVKDDDGKPLYVLTDSDNNVYYGRTLILAPGRTPMIPPVFEQAKSNRIIHLNDYLKTMSSLPAASLERIAVVGGSQSAVEILVHLSDTHPQSELIGISRCFGYKQKDVNPFTGEVYFQEFVDLFYYANRDTKRRLQDDLRLTNYSASDADVLDALYRKMYMQEVQGKEKIIIHRSAEVQSVAAIANDKVRIGLSKLERPGILYEDVSLAIMATGFKDIGQPGDNKRGNFEPYPPLFEPLVPHMLLDEEGCLLINRNYSVTLKAYEGHSCFVNGLCESSHGMGDAGSFSLLGFRSGEIVEELNHYIFKDALPARATIIREEGAFA